VLRVATNAEEVPGVVAFAATDKGVVYEGIFGRRRLHRAPATTRDTVFRVASLYDAWFFFLVAVVSIWEPPRGRGAW
jgi:methyl acetate hydrolase